MRKTVIYLLIVLVIFGVGGSLVMWQMRSNGQPQEQAQEPETDQDKKPRIAANQNDLQLLARAVHAEAKGEPYVGKVAIAAVILNRLEHPEFPNSLSGVIYEPLA